ncbi:transglycosylase domain-containing protein [Pseudonocardia sp. HH130629-09]|uniref:transglycosylase domain-containing protein n=1 Tax=Pseudonocardia sp. HH130629-09 TaxID=1641402 RepID=UPI000A5B9A4E|nr:transglycosylase domain-containing protein [Pseudonocardia sp. HH130629-09]
MGERLIAQHWNDRLRETRTGRRWRRPDPSVLRRLGIGILAGGLVLAGCAAPAAAGVAAVASVVPPGTTGDLPNAAALPAATVLTDRDGTPIAYLDEQYRIPVPYDRISPSMVAAIVDVEDRRFFDESGVDPVGTLRALVTDAAGGAVQGGSTITQQYVKNWLIDVVDRDDPAAQRADHADTPTRKIREAVLAQRLAHSTSKQDVLAGYLNTVEFTGNVYGVEVAARAWFGTDAAHLTVPQAALLAGAVNNPTLFDPFRHPQAATDRRNTVIAAMRDAGSLTPAQAAEATTAPLGVRPGGPQVPGHNCYGATDGAGFLCEHAVSELEKAGFTEQQLDTGGYTIRTTLDPAATASAQQAVDANVPRTQDGVANTLALIRPGRGDAATGDHQILAMVANRRPGTDAAAGDTTRDLVAAPSNVFGAGSTFKIFTTAAALEAGTVGYDSTLPDPASACFPGAGSSCYPVSNDTPNYPDPIPLPVALATSPNTAFVDLEERTGIPRVVEMARRLGLRDTLASNAAGGTPDPSSPDARISQPQSQFFADLPSFTLGVGPVSTLEEANVAATIQSDGVWCAPDAVLSVTGRDGAAVPVNRPACEQAVAPGVAHTLAAGLGGDTVTGTSAAAARAAGWTRPTIGKTGTTNSSESVAFVGATGGIDGVAGSSMVFADGPNPSEICPGDPVHLGDCGHGAFGGTVAAPPFFAAVDPLVAGRADVPLPDPDPAYLQPRNG